MKKKTKKKLFISFYQYDMDDPVIIGFDSIEAARKEAKKDIRQALPNRKDWKEYLESFEKDGYVAIGDILIYAREIACHASAEPETWVLLTELNVDALSDADAVADTQLFESFEAAEEGLKYYIEDQRCCLNNDAKKIAEHRLDKPATVSGEGNGRKLTWSSKYLNVRYSVYRQEYTRL